MRRASLATDSKTSVPEPVTFASSLTRRAQSQVGMVVSHKLDAVFKTLMVLNEQLSQCFSESATPVTSVQLQPVQELYKTVCDKDGRLGLQPANAKGLKNGFSFLNTKTWQEAKASTLIDYTGASLIGASLGIMAAECGVYGFGLTAASEAFKAAYATDGIIAGAQAGAAAMFSGGAGLTSAVQAYQSAYDSEGVTGGIQAGATALFSNPITTSVATFGVGLALFRDHQQRKFSFAVQRAISLYNEAILHSGNNKIAIEKLLEARALLQNEDQKRIVNVIRKPISASNVAEEFAKLLQEQIKIKLLELVNKGNYHLSTLEDICAQTKNKDIKGMTLIVLITLLSGKTKIINPIGIELDKQGKSDLLKLKVAQLNSDHQALIQLYFKRIWSVYQVLLALLKDGVMTKLNSPEEFAVLRNELDQMIKFNGIVCFQHMGSKGTLCEALLIFVQGLCHVLYADFYNNMAQKYRDNSAMNKAQIQEREAVEKFEYITPILAEIRESELIEPFTPEMSILETIESFVKAFIASYNAEQEQMMVQRSATITKRTNKPAASEVRSRFTANLFNDDVAAGEAVRNVTSAMYAGLD